MTAISTSEDPTAGRAATEASAPVAKVGERIYGLLGSVPTVVLWAVVALWTVPTSGVLVSSLRPGVEVRSSGWWSELPNPLPDRLGRTLLALAVVLVVVMAAAYLVSRPAGRLHQLGVAAVPLVLVVATAVGYRDMYVALPQALAILGVIAAVGVGALAIRWLFDRLSQVGRLVFVGVLGVVGVVALLLLGTADAAGPVMAALGLVGFAVLWGVGLVFDRLPPLARIALGAALGVAGAAAVLLSMTELTFDSYREVFDTTDMGTAFRNTVAITVPATVIPIAIAAFAAYAFAWMDFKGRHWLFIGMVALLAVPFQMSLIPLLQLYNNGASLTVAGETIRLFPDLNLAGTTEAVWLTHIGFGLPLAVFLLHNYIASLPRDIFEAARIDGADHLTIFWRVVLPLSVPALAAFAIFQFLWVWNDYLVARTFLGSGSSLAPMTIELDGLAGARGQAWHLLTSAAFISIAVPLGIFFALQRYFVRGLLAGSVKG